MPGVDEVLCLGEVLPEHHPVHGTPHEPALTKIKDANFRGPKGNCASSAPGRLEPGLGNRQRSRTPSTTAPFEKVIA